MPQGRGCLSQVRGGLSLGGGGGGDFFCDAISRQLLVVSR